MKTRLFTRRELIGSDARAVVMLAPLLGLPVDRQPGPDEGRFDDYADQAGEIFELVETLDRAHAVVYPMEYRPDADPALLKTLVADARDAGKPVLVFFNSDLDTPIDLGHHVHVFRTTGYRSMKKPTEHGYPGWSVDFMRYSDGRLNVLPKAPKPRVGYCGYIDHTGPLSWIRYQTLKAMHRHPRGADLRGRAIRQLLADRRVETDVLFRKGFWADGERDKHRARLDYARNMLASPYTLVVRGAGNFSYRLYEALSCGRIPLFVDTDCLLPFDDHINWREHVVWVDPHDLDRIAERLIEFHSRISLGDFEAMQRRNRELYERWISPVGFFRQLSAWVRRG
ncbi:MAG: hypothetical protein GC164_03050 [Phycisphaera sp.]|nr:hypothetical protein [Phycisphaera sp.]